MLRSLFAALRRNDSRDSTFETLGSIGGAPVLRPGQSIPAAAPAVASVPPPPRVAVEPSRPRLPRGALRRSLVASSIEGGFAEVVGACAGGSVLTGWALYLDCSPLEIAVLSAIPFVGQIAHLPAAAVTARWGAKRVALWTVLAARQVYLVLAALPFLGVAHATERVVLMSVAATAAVLGVLGNNAWQAWMAALVPQRMRGRYFGRRTAVCTGAGAAASLAAGLAIDRGARASGAPPSVLGALALVAALAGVAAAFYMSRQYEPPDATPPRSPLAPLARFESYVEPLRHGPSRGLLAYLGVWNAANGLSSGFWAVHMLTNLHLGFARVALEGTALALVRMLTAPLWGRALDRAGARRVLVVCTLGLSVVPLMWAFARPDFLLPVVLDALVGGALVSGHGLAVFALPLAVAPARERPFFVAAFSVTGGASFGVAAAAGGALVTTLGARATSASPFVAFQTLFVLAAVARLAAAVVASRWVLTERAAPAVT